MTARPDDRFYSVLALCAALASCSCHESSSRMIPSEAGLGDPVVAILTPTEGEVVGGTVQVTGTASDDMGIGRVEVRVDSGSFATATGTASWTYTVDATSLSAGSHTISARAYDTSDVVSSTVTIHITVASGVSSVGSTEVGRTNFSDRGVSNAAPPTSLFLGAWTHVYEAPSDTHIGNDYPFAVKCAESNEILIMISGNIQFDSAANAYLYNANITTRTGDHVTVLDRSTQARTYGWVYVAWHFLRSGSNTIVTQYLKYGADQPARQVAQETLNNEVCTPNAVNVGGYDWTNGDGVRMYMQYARVYGMASTPTASQVNTIAMRTTPDPSAWADWPMVDASTADVSGNGHTLSIVGTWYPGIAGPALPR